MSNDDLSFMELGEKGHFLQDETGWSYQQVADHFEQPVRRMRDSIRKYRKKNHILPPDVAVQVSIDQESPNLAKIRSIGRRILTIEELAEATGLSLDEWIIEKQRAKKWEVARKHTVKDLEWNDARMDGWLVDDGEMLVEQLVSVSYEAVRKDPEPIMPTITPVSYSGRFARPRMPKKRPFSRSLIWSDPHFGFRRRVHDAKLKPFHDRRVLDLILQIAAATRPDKMHILGDWFDLAEFTDKFLKTPEFHFTFQPAIYESHWWLVQMAKLAREVYMHEGNHDLRLPNAIKRHLIFAYGLRPAHERLLDAPAVLSVQSLLGLEKLGVEWIDEYPNDREWLAEKLALYHGNISRQNPLDLAKALAKGNVSRICGHNHRHERTTQIRESAGGDYVVHGYSIGCACHVDHRVPGHRHSQHWAQSLVVVDVFDFKRFAITPIVVENGTAILNGRMFEARDRVPELTEVLPEWNW